MLIRCRDCKSMINTKEKHWCSNNKALNRIYALVQSITPPEKEKLHGCNQRKGNPEKTEK